MQSVQHSGSSQDARNSLHTGPVASSPHENSSMGGGPSPDLDRLSRSCGSVNVTSLIMAANVRYASAWRKYQGDENSQIQGLARKLCGCEHYKLLTAGNAYAKLGAEFPIFKALVWLCPRRLDAPGFRFGSRTRIWEPMEQASPLSRALVLFSGGQDHRCLPGLGACALRRGSRPSGSTMASATASRCRRAPVRSRRSLAPRFPEWAARLGEATSWTCTGFGARVAGLSA